MSTPRVAATITVELSPEAVEQIAQRAAELLLTQQHSNTPYLTVKEAADYLRCSRQRVYDLLSARRIAKHKDGTRVLVLRDELDSYLRSQALRVA